MILLRTKYFTAEYESGTIRRIRSGSTEIVRMIYPSLRDHNWETIPGELVSEKKTRKKNRFQMECMLRYSRNDIQFEVHIQVIASDDRLIYNMQGESKSDFLSNRTGLCLLHPIRECAGKPCQIIHPDESSEIKVFPNQIAAHTPMKNISEMIWDPAENIRAKLIFTGDIFEMEDQRNWTDASYKTYCRPLDLPFPFEIKAGQIMNQRIELEIESVSFPGEEENVISFKVDRDRIFEIPETGICNTSRKEEMTMREASLLKKLPLQHLRTELRLYSGHWTDDFQKALAETDKLDLPLFLVLLLSGNFETEIRQLAAALPVKDPRVSQILVTGKNHLPDDAVFGEVSGALRMRFPEAEIGTGVNAYFAELNRNRPQTAQADFVSFTISPQVHAFDNTTLVENLEAQKYTLESAKNLFPGKAIYLSPIALKQRFSVVATSGESPLPPGELPPQVDPRQNSVFAAQWLMGSLKYAAQSGAELLTYFETVGWQGFIQGDYDPPLPEKFSAKKGEIFPVYHLLKEFKDYRQIVYSESTSPLEIEGIVLKTEGYSGQKNYKIMLANFSDQQKKVSIPGLKNPGESRSLFGKKSVRYKRGIMDVPSHEILILELPEAGLGE